MPRRLPWIITISKSNSKTILPQSSSMNTLYRKRLLEDINTWGNNSTLISLYLPFLTILELRIHLNSLFKTNTQSIEIIEVEWSNICCFLRETNTETNSIVNKIQHSKFTEIFLGLLAVILLGVRICLKVFKLRSTLSNSDRTFFFCRCGVRKTSRSSRSTAPRENDLGNVSER